MYEPILQSTDHSRPHIDGAAQLRFVRADSDVHTWLSKEHDFLHQFKSQGVFSFHYYDPWTFFYSFLNQPDNMYNKKREWPSIFRKMYYTGVSRGLVPFLTEFGGSQDWERLVTNLEPENVYDRKQIRAYMNLLFIQIEALLMNSTYWNYDLYNTVEDNDNWNLENFSLLGPNRVPRHIDIIARPYPSRSSAQPFLLSFDLDTKYCVIILKGVVVNEPTIIYVPYRIHYSSGFRVWATSNSIRWEKEQNSLYWYPSQNMEQNQIIITPVQELDRSILPPESNKIFNKTTFSFTFS
jgi:hypothetical protein